MSQPTQYIPVRSNDVATSPPLPDFSRSSRRASTPAAIVMPVTWSPTALRMAGGMSSGGTCNAAIDERAQNAPTS